jgi:histidine triad (HIT) family protein
MSLDGAYEGDNIFARIVRGEIPAARICEDETTLAFMDAFPQSRGHCLIIHKASRARNLLDAERYALAEIMVTTQRVARAVRSALQPDGIMISQFNGSVAGQTVFHLHVHIIPRWRDVPLGRHAGGGMADMGELGALARQIAQRLEP